MQDEMISVDADVGTVRQTKCFRCAVIVDEKLKKEKSADRPVKDDNAHRTANETSATVVPDGVHVRGVHATMRHLWDTNFTRVVITHRPNAARRVVSLATA
jgi:predicted MPP superfamily phosphohydrolase